jgi:hypothetical protein
MKRLSPLIILALLFPVLCYAGWFSGGGGGSGTGNVSGPASSTTGDAACYNDGTGKVLNDCGVKPLPFVTLDDGGITTYCATCGPGSGPGFNATTVPGTGILTALAVNVGTAGAPVINGGALGIPSGGTLTNVSGLPISGIASLGTGEATALALAPNNTSAGGGHVTTTQYVTPYQGAGANPQTQGSATAGVTCDLSLGNTCEITLAASSTAMAVALSHGVVGQIYRLAFIEPSSNMSNGYTPTYSGYTVKWIGGTAMALSTGASYVDYATCYMRTGPVLDCGIGLASH